LRRFFNGKGRKNVSISWVSDFTAGDGTMRELLGGKGAGLAEMTRIGLAVPPGFTVTTDACRYVMEHGDMPADLWQQVDAAMARLEATMERTFGGGRPHCWCRFVPAPRSRCRA
jgi:pyruvate, orthophosphate dikinase